MDLNGNKTTQAPDLGCDIPNKTQLYNWHRKHVSSTLAFSITTSQDHKQNLNQTCWHPLEFSLCWFYLLKIFEPRCLQSQLLQLLKFVVSPAFPRLFGFLFSTSVVALCSIQLLLGLMTSTRLNHMENHGNPPPVIIFDAVLYATLSDHPWPPVLSTPTFGC